MDSEKRKLGTPQNKRYRKEESSSESDNDYVPYVPVKERKKLQLMKLGRLSQLKEEFGQRRNSSSENEHHNDDEDGQVWGRKSNISLLDQFRELKKLAQAKKESAM
jgi:ATP-dependent RNA helicase DDX41